MAKLQRKSAKEARNGLSALLTDAENGRATIITRHGRSIAALVSVNDLTGARQKPLTALAGSGKGMWSKDSAGSVGRLRAATRNFLANAERVAAAGVRPMSEEQVQAEIVAARKARRRNRVAPRR